MYFLLLLTGIFISEVKCGYYFVTAPNVIRFDHEETVVVGVFGLTNAEVKVWLQHGENKFSEKHVTVLNEYAPFHTTVKATEIDLFNTNADVGKPTEIKLCAEWNGQTRSIEIVVSYRTGYLIVQTDKPIYTPRQRVRIRTIALDESLRAVNNWQVGMDIVSPSDTTVARRTIVKSNSGFFHSEFALPPNPEIGRWKARAFYTGQFETESEAFFEVKEYVLPTFGVTVDVDVPCILNDTTDILVTVRAKYVYGKPVDGKARLTLNLKNQAGLSEHILDIIPKLLENNHGEEVSVTDFNISVADIRNSPLLRDRDFPPDGSRLEIVATVFESATGKEEATSHGETIFAINPYIFKFTRSKLNFRPGMDYNLKVDMLYANGQPVAKQTIKVKMFQNGQFDSSKYVTIDSKGQAATVFYTSLSADTITFVAATSDESYESEHFEVNAYVGKNQIQVEHLIKDDEMVLRAFTNMRGTGYTGMLLMVVVRGKIVYTKFKWAANQFSERIVEELQEKVSPNARVLVFYIDKSTHELVADSVKFDVNKKCRGEGLKLKTQVEVRPDSSERITVTGSPFMWVGFSVIDKALFLLNDNNVLKKDKMFDFLEAHDLGCGEGGGRTSADVFKKSGLTILTNAAVDDSDLVRYSDRCEGKKRKKRDNGETSHVVKRSLYEESEYISDLKLLAENVVRPRIRSDVRESWFFETTQLDINGQRLEILIFPDSITEWMIQAVGITPDKGLCIADAIDVKAFKSFFIQLDVPYKAVRLKKIDMKATIFSYRNHFLSKDKTANIYFESAEHVCSNNKPGLPSSRIQVKLAPNSFETVNFPIIPLRFGLFPIRVTAVVTEAGIPEVDIVEKKLFVVNEGVEEQITINVCLDLWNQTDDCKNDERVISDYHSSIGTLLQVDLTLPEASIPHTGAATAYIQSNRMDNVVNTMIEDVASLIKEPSGSGEQIMSRLAPTVYAMRYLKETNQMTRELDIKGNQWIRDGVSAEISEYRQNDGSYAAWRYRKPSTWLTAFVAKVFCKARSVVDDAVDEQEDIKITINWLQNHVEYDGSFVDNMPVLDRGMMGQTGVSDPSLTAFVLVSILECNMLSYKSETVRKATQYLERVSEKLLKNNPYLLAISTYALALATSKEAYRFKGYLHDIQYRDEKDMYWGYAGVRPESAQSVETTSYALLAMIKFGDFKSSAFIVQWLTSQREARGSFSSTQDTVICLQALSQYKIATHSAEMDLRVNLLSTEWRTRQILLTGENTDVQQIVKKLPVERGDNKLTVHVSGSGTARMIIDLRYNRPATKEEKCPFEISPIEVEETNQVTMDGPIAKERGCDICGRCELDPGEPDNYDFNMFGPSAEESLQIPISFGRRKRQAYNKICIRFQVSSINEKVHGKSIVKVGLQSGVETSSEDLEKLLENNRNIARYELPSNGKGFVVFYLSEITPNETKFIFRLNDNFKGAKSSRQPAAVEVYDYYNPDKHCTQFYRTDPNTGADIGVDYECDGDGKQCNCLQNTCVQPVEEEILRLVKNRRKPALMLFKYMCDLRKANYAVHVKIKSLTYNLEKNQIIAAAKVLKAIHQEIQKPKVDDMITFFWSINCKLPSLEEGKEYIIIGKDGNNFSTDGREQYRYELSETALVISRNQRNRKLQRVLNNFIKFSEKGCQV